MAKGGSELTAYMMDYVPFHGGENDQDLDSQTLVYLKGDGVYDQDRREDFLSRVRGFLQRELLEIGRSSKHPVVLALAPGHKRGPPSGFLLEVAQEVLQKLDRKHPNKFEDGFTQLVRTEKVAKSATASGRRNKAKHRDSIDVDTPPGVDSESLNTGKVVCILDDVWTSGATLSVCGEKISTTGASDVKLIAIGKTV